MLCATCISDKCTAFPLAGTIPLGYMLLVQVCVWVLGVGQCEQILARIHVESLRSLRVQCLSIVGIYDLHVFAWSSGLELKIK
jgi:hypothetical protein